jgi:predicted DNA-binding protein (MmcQ/YjbR family)
MGVRFTLSSSVRVWQSEHGDTTCAESHLCWFARLVPRSTTSRARRETGPRRAEMEKHPTITPGRYLDKRHWISVGPGPQITAELVRELVTLSYDDVLDNVPRDQRP